MSITEVLFYFIAAPALFLLVSILIIVLFVNIAARLGGKNNEADLAAKRKGRLWFLIEGKNEVGPFTFEQLQKRYLAGEIHKDTECRERTLFGSPAWTTLQAALPDLTETLGESVVSTVANDDELKPCWEVKRADGSIRQFCGERQITEGIIAGEIQTGYLTRPVNSAAASSAIEADWKSVSYSLAKSSFRIRTLFTPVWAHSIRGAEMGASIGLLVWFALNAVGYLGAGILAGFNPNHPSGVASKFLALAIVWLYWLGNFFHLFCQINLEKSVAARTGVFAKQLFSYAVIALIVVAGMSGDVSGVFAGLFLGLQSAFGAVVVGLLYGISLGMVVGTFVGLIRLPRLRRSPMADAETMWLVILKGLVLPGFLLAAALTIHIKYYPQLEKSFEEALNR